MVAIARTHTTAAGLILPLVLLAGLLTVIGAQIEWPKPPPSVGTGPAPATTSIASRPYTYREPGEFYRGMAQLDGRLIAVEAAAPLEIMTYQVSVADYARCVADSACRTAAPRRRGNGDVPVTGVSFDDANDYAAWLSRQTGASWRLPTVAEWVFAAGERAVDPALGTDAAADDPIERWIALYEREAELGADALAAPEPLGSFGFNGLGVADIGGTVWEWTATCASRTTLAANGAVLATLPSCGVRYVEGRHRTQVTAFIRDARAGGCSTGTPPDNLGFRLVREPGWLERLFGALPRR